MQITARLTEERLRSWLDGDQPAQERLCAHILRLDRRFSDVRSRQPKGGADGGYDLEALRDGQRALAAIGFRNSPNDAAADQRWLARKFRTDLARCIETADKFVVFVFLTNVRLTVATRKRMVEHARTAYGVSAEAFDRESLRISLDTPDGLAVRYQFLQIPLSEAEQSSFFSRWALISRILLRDRLRRSRIDYGDSNSCTSESSACLG